MLSTEKLTRPLPLKAYSASHSSRNRLQNPARAVKSIADLCITPITLELGFLLRPVRGNRPQFIVRYRLDHDPCIERYAIRWHVIPPLEAHLTVPIKRTLRHQVPERYSACGQLPTLQRNSSSAASQYGCMKIGKEDPLCGARRHQRLKLTDRIQSAGYPRPTKVSSPTV